MGDNRPTIPAGDVIRSLKLPPWLRWILNLVKGVKIQAGGVDILLDQKGGAMPPRTGLDQPHKLEPPKPGGGRWPA
jgi:hypothetical protein